MPFIEETAEFLKNVFTLLGQFDNIGGVFVALWDAFVTLLVNWWDIFSGFFVNLFKF